MYKIMYKYAGRWYPLTSNGCIIYFIDKSKCEDYARYIDSNNKSIWSEWFCAFDSMPDNSYNDIKGYRK